LAILVRDRTLRVAVVRLILGMSPVLDVVTIALFTLHDAMDSARGAVLAIVIQTMSKLPLFALTMALVDVSTSVAPTLVLVEVGAQVAALRGVRTGLVDFLLDGGGGSLLSAGRLGQLHECRLDEDAADLDVVLLSFTRVVATRR
jgi:putative NIF3 family GTP cyclohydrolase 1 type 2